MLSTHLALGPGSEFDTVRATLARWGPLARGTGDDAAVLDVPAGVRLVASTDVSVENVHFRRAWFSPAEIAYRAAASAVSDLAAMGATPLAMVVAFTLPDSWRAESMALADGIGIVARDTGTTIVGGDLSRGTELSICVTALGTVERPLSRRGAVEGQAVWVTGLLGGPRLALQALERGVAPLAAHRARFAHPVPRLREARWLNDHGATAAIDCSDGVVADATHIAVASMARVALHLDRLPVISGATDEDAAASGEEYELIVTAPETLDAAAFTREFGLPLTAIGRVERAGREGPGLDAFRDGVRVPGPLGHDHFAT